MFSLLETSYSKFKNTNIRRKPFILIANCLKIFGLYSKSEKLSWPYFLYRWLGIILFINGFAFGQICYFVKHYENGLMANLGKIYTIPETLMSVFKAIYMRNNIRKILTLIEEEYEGEIFKTRNSEQQQICEQTCDKFYKLCILIYACGFLTALFLFVGLPLPTDLPFMDPLTDAYYIFIWHALCLNFSAFCTLSYDLLAAGIMIIIANQIDLLANELDNLQVSKNDEMLLKAKDSELQLVYERFYYCIKKHQSIKQYIEKFLKIYNPVVFVVFAGSVISLACATNEISLPNQKSAAYLFFIFYMITMLMDILLYCWTGNNITYKSNMLTFNAWNGDWYLWSREKRRDYLIFLHCLQKPIQLNTGRMFPLSLKTFTTIVKASWSYGTTLRSRN